MASQQAWDDFENVKSLLLSSNAVIVGTLRVCLEELNNLAVALMADPARLSAAEAIGNTHPVFIGTYMESEAARILALRSWLIANGYFAE